ncbi:MAG: S41 family peptidase [Erythrobacter sp.]
MHLGRTILSATLAVSLTACGGGGSGNAPGGSTGGGGIGASDCTLGARQDWVLSVLNEWYRFPNLLDTTVNKANHSSLQSYVNAVTQPSEQLFGAGKTFTYITSIAEENALISSGSSAGFGIRLSYDFASSRVYVIEAFENAPAFAQGIDRGTEIIAINGQTTSSLLASGNASAFLSALGPSDAGVTRSLTIRQPGGAQSTVSVTKAEYSLDPMSDTYGAKILDNGGTKVGYINLRTFIVDDASSQLRTAIGQFKAQGVNQVILDLRYNGGGLVSVANTLGDLLGANHVGQLFSNTTYRSTKSSNDVRRVFGAESQAIAATKIAVIGTRATASASELVANAYIPYLNDNIALVGGDTYGKPVGQNAFDRSACDDRLRAVTFKTDNAAGGGDYYSGLASVMPVTCAAGDDIFTPLGDPSEDSISVALDYLAGRSCTAISKAGAGTTAQETAGTRRMLGVPDRPSAAQLQIPGLF